MNSTQHFTGSYLGVSYRIWEDKDFQGALGAVCLRHRSDPHKSAQLDVRERRLDDADSDCVICEHDLEFRAVA